MRESAMILALLNLFCDETNYKNLNYFKCSDVFTFKTLLHNTFYSFTSRKYEE